MNKIENIVYRIVDRESGEIKSVYSRAYHDQIDFDSIDKAKNSNCWGIYKDENKFKISKYRIIYELIEDDVK